MIDVGNFALLWVTLRIHLLLTDSAHVYFVLFSLAPKWQDAVTGFFFFPFSLANLSPYPSMVIVGNKVFTDWHSIEIL